MAVKKLQKAKVALERDVLLELKEVSFKLYKIILICLLLQLLCAICLLTYTCLKGKGLRTL